VVGSTRFYLDEDLPYTAATVARSLGVDAIAAVEHGPTPRPDGEHLQEAAAQGRIVVTYNRNDFIEETRDAFAAGKPHAGVLILTYRLPRDPWQIARALHRWGEERGPMQPYESQFLSR
jgi:predicted nuclease of predicted toxin-antitoxin system